jgi:hypothetical protein
VANNDNDSRNVDLRPLIARLKEIERKCDSMGTRNEEFPLMKDRLVSIISRLEAGEEPSGEPLAYRAMARELFPVAHLFESVGFMSVGKEVAHVERSLQDLEPASASAAGPGDSVRASTTSSAVAAPSPEKTGAQELERGEAEEDATGAGIPKPILAGLFLLLIAVAVAAALILELGPFQPKSTPVPPTPTAVPSPTPEPPPTPAQSVSVALPSTRERFADALSQARLSLSQRDFDGAVKYLSIAALIDRHDTSVLEIAELVLDQRLQDANEAAAEARWEDAGEIISHARSIAKRFELDTHPIDAAENRYAEMMLSRIVQPEEIQALRAAIGKQVEVKLDNGSVLEGRIAGITGTNLVLDIDDDVGGGIVSFTDEVPLSSIRWIKIWED